MIETYQFSNLSDNDKIIIANIVSASSHPDTQLFMTGNDHSLASVEPSEILASELALVGFVQDSFAGYIRAKTRIVDSERDKTFRQVGSLVVIPKFRSKGIGKQLVGELTDIVNAVDIPYAFCGPASQAIFEKVGYKIALPGQLPSDAVSLRGNQAMIYDSRD